MPYTRGELASILNRQSYPWSLLLTIPVRNSLPDATISARTKWQRDITSFKTFTVYLQLASKDMLDLALTSRYTLGGFVSTAVTSVGPYACNCRRQDDVIRALASKTTNIRAKKIIVSAT